jgi:succinate dehydrogenase/fumarate reductase flavoprotein subunit
VNEKVIVIGGGYAGVMAANRAAGHGGSVALVNAYPPSIRR